MLKILMIAPCPYILSEIKGGVEAVTVNLLEGFKNVPNIHLHIISINKGISISETVRYSDNIIIQYIPYGVFNSTKLEMLFHGRMQLKRIIKKFQPDIIHVQGNGSILMLLAGIRKNNVVITQHGILSEEFKQQDSLFSKASYAINILTEKIFGRNIKSKIFISKYNMNMNKLTALKNYRLIYNPVKSTFFEIESSTANKSNIFFR